MRIPRRIAPRDDRPECSMKSNTIYVHPPSKGDGFANGESKGMA
jgi:hypothetical protein